MKLSRFGVAGVLLAVGVLPCWAQNSTTSLHGRVTDQTSAAVAGAHVTIEDKAKGSKQERVTTEQGEYSFAQVLPGTYTITVTASGFGAQNKLAELLVNLPATVDFALSIREVSEVVNVSGTVATLNTTDATIGNAFDNQ